MFNLVMSVSVFVCLVVTARWPWTLENWENRENGHATPVKIREIEILMKMKNQRIKKIKLLLNNVKIIYKIYFEKFLHYA